MAISRRQQKFLFTSSKWWCLEFTGVCGNKVVRSANTGCYATLCSYVEVYCLCPNPLNNAQVAPQDPNTTVSVTLQTSTATQSGLSVQQLRPEVSSQHFCPDDLSKWLLRSCSSLSRGVTMGEAAVLVLETWGRTGGALLKTFSILSSPMTVTSVRLRSQTRTNPQLMTPGYLKMNEPSLTHLKWDWCEV